MTSAYEPTGAYDRKKVLNALGGDEGLSRKELAVSPESTADLAAQATQQVTVELAEIQAAAQESLDLLASIAAPDMYKYAFPPLYITLWTMLREELVKIRNFPQIALGLPRGFAKTVVIKLLILYIILFTQKRFILILCENEQKAKNILSDVAAMLDEPNIIATFGDWKLGRTQDTQTIKRFGFRGRNIVLMGAGAGTGIRGMTLDNRRPDVMVFDDIQSKEEAKSEQLSDALEEWMLGTAMKAKDPEGCMFLFIANMYPTKGSLLRRIKSNPEWVKYIVGGILANGESLWEALHPISQLQREFRNDLAAGRPELFYAEVLNDEFATANTQLNLSDLIYPYLDDEVHAGNFIIIDPSGNKPESDPTSVGYFEVHDTVPCFIDLDEGLMSPGETIRSAILMCMKYNCRLVAIEGTAYQASLAYWADFICEQLGIEGIKFVAVYPGRKEKNTRILESFKSLMAREVFIKPGTIAHTKYSLQVMYFDHLKRKNNDGVLDVVTYAPKVVEEFGHELSFGTVWDSNDLDAIDVEASNVNF